MIKETGGKIGSVYDNAVVESINELYKTGLTKRQNWKTWAELKLATLQWLHW